MLQQDSQKKDMVQQDSQGSVKDIIQCNSNDVYISSEHTKH